MEQCEICGSYGLIEKHHIIHRSQSASLKNCKLNLIDLCPKCHRIIHSRYGRKLDVKLKTKYYSNMRNLFKNDKYTIDEIQFILDIPLKDATRLCKTICEGEGIIYKEKLILALMGFKLNLEGIEYE